MAERVMAEMRKFSNRFGVVKTEPFEDFSHHSLEVAKEISLRYFTLFAFTD